MKIKPTYFYDYLNEQKKLIDGINVEKQIIPLVEKIIKAIAAKKKIFVIGNGGSAANASHFAMDLNKFARVDGKRARAIALTDSVSAITATANDYMYEHVFVEQLENLLDNGDMLICLGVSGKSANCIEAASFARTTFSKVEVISLFGSLKLNAAHIEEFSDFCVNISEFCDKQTLEHYGRVEDMEMIILHMVIYYFKDYYE